MSYLIQEADYFVNYLFRKDLTYTRLKNTTKIIETICYTKQQKDIVKKLHPKGIVLNYKVSTRETKNMFQVPINRLQSDHLNKIHQYLKNN